MNRPHAVRLLGVSIPVFVSNCKSKDLSDELETVFGEWDLNRMTITLDEGCAPIHEKITLLHELIHAIDDLLNLDLTHQDIYSISQVLFSLLVDNPKLVDYLTSRSSSIDSASP